MKESTMSTKPFVYPFCYIGNYYLFDVNRNQIIKVPKQVYSAIVSNNEDIPAIVRECINNLLEEGYLLPNDVVEIFNPLDKYKEDYLNGNLKGMILQVTQNCNLKCRYCIYAGNTNLSRGHTSKNMTWEVAKKSIDFFAEKSIFSQTVEVGFYGGEPLLSFEMLKKCVDYLSAKLYDRVVRYKITSNGTIMDDDILSFLEENDIDFTVSIDGTENIHNANRRYAYDGRGSFEKIINNLTFMKSKNPDYYKKKVQFNSVIASQEKWDEIMYFFKTNELFKDNPVFLNNVSDNYLKESYKGSSDQRANNERIKFDSMMAKYYNTEKPYYGSIADEITRLRKLFSPMEPLPSQRHHLGPCMPGYRHLFVDVVGNLRVCEKASEKSKHLIIGNVDYGFDFDAISKLLNIGQMTDEECKMCPFIRSCKICAVSIDSVDKLSIEKKFQLCKHNKKKIINDLKDYVIYKEVGLI